MTPTQAQIEAAEAGLSLMDECVGFTKRTRERIARIALTAAAEVGYVNIEKPPGGQRHPPGTCEICDTAAAEVGEQDDLAIRFGMQTGGDLWKATIERCAQVAEQTETWIQHVEKTDSQDIYTGEYESVERTTPKWNDGKEIAAAIRKLKDKT